MLSELIESGKKLLQSRPMDREGYFAWSDEARQKIGDVYGESSPQAMEFVKARWEIKTSIDSDPSMYLTQLGANLRRELRVLEKLERDGPPTPAAGSKPAKTTPKPEAPPAEPAAATTAATAAATRRVLVLAGEDEELASTVSGVVEEQGFAPIDIAIKGREALFELRSSPVTAEIAAALVIVDPGVTGEAPDAGCVFELGLLVGALGSERVVALVAEGIKLPRSAVAVSRIDLGRGMTTAKKELVERLTSFKSS